jgi:hypothetical protein
MSMVAIFLMGLVLQLSVATASAEPKQWLVGIKVVSGGSTEKCPGGYDKNPQDLNEGAGGKFIYLCSKYSNDSFHAIGQVDVAATGRSSIDPCPRGTTQIRQDLNEGAGGAFVYFCETFRGGGPGLRAIDFSVWSTVPSIYNRPCSSWSPHLGDDAAKAGWVLANHVGFGDVSNGDLNEGAGGKYIYACEFVAQP